MPNVVTHNRIKHDSAIVWRPGRVWLPATHFTGVTVGAINEGGAGNFAAGVKMESVHTGAQFAKEISTFGVAAMLPVSAADELNTYMTIPYDLDLGKRIYARVHWAANSTTITDTISWKVWYKPLVYNLTAISAIGNTGGTALDRVIATQTYPTAVAYTWNVTAEGYLDAGKLPETTEALLLSVEMDAITGLAGDKFLLGLEIRYTPKRLLGPDGMQHEAKAPTYTAGKNYAN